MEIKEEAKTLDAALLELAEEEFPQLAELVKEEVESRPPGWKPLR